MIVLLTAFFDIGSYFAGRAIGRHPIAPILSPKKTWEGFVGGIVTAVAVAALLSTIDYFILDLRHALILAGIVVLLAPLGDAAESMIKRSLGVKDMGSVLPGTRGDARPDRCVPLRRAFRLPVFPHRRPFVSKAAGRLGRHRFGGPSDPGGRRPTRLPDRRDRGRNARSGTGGRWRWPIRMLSMAAAGGSIEERRSFESAVGAGGWSSGPRRCRPWPPPPTPSS